METLVTTRLIILKQRKIRRKRESAWWHWRCTHKTQKRRNKKNTNTKIADYNCQDKRNTLASYFRVVVCEIQLQSTEPVLGALLRLEIKTPRDDKDCIANSTTTTKAPMNTTKVLMPRFAGIIHVQYKKGQYIRHELDTVATPIIIILAGWLELKQFMMTDTHTHTHTHTHKESIQ